MSLLIGSMTLFTQVPPLRLGFLAFLKLLSHIPSDRFTLENGVESMDAMKRGNLLGEEVLPTRAKSVFAYLSEQDRKRLASLGVGPDAMAKMPQPPSSNQVVRAGAAGGVLLHQAFAHSPAKQERWRQFLLEQSGEIISPSPADGMTDWERQQERVEFEALAAQFKRLPDSMAHRFTPAQEKEGNRSSFSVGKIHLSPKEKRLWHPRRVIINTPQLQ